MLRFLYNNMTFVGWRVDLIQQRIQSHPTCNLQAILTKSDYMGIHIYTTEILQSLEYSFSPTQSHSYYLHEMNTYICFFLKDTFNCCHYILCTCKINCEAFDFIFIEFALYKSFIMSFFRMKKFLCIV